MANGIFARKLFATVMAVLVTVVTAYFAYLTREQWLWWVVALQALVSLRAIYVMVKGQWNY